MSRYLLPTLAACVLTVIRPASNLVPLYEAFAVKLGDRMYRADPVRARIW
jgi:predicted metalloendopeptidase